MRRKFASQIRETLIQNSGIFTGYGNFTSHIWDICHRANFNDRRGSDMKLRTIITSLCKKKGWSLSRLAKEAGVPVQTVHNWLTARKSINPDQIQKAAQALGVSVHYLLFGVADPNEKVGEEILREIFTGDVRVTLHRIERRKV